VAACLSNLAVVARDQGDHRRSAALAQESLTLFHELGDHRGIVACLNLIGGAIAAQGNAELGTRLLAAAAALHEAIGRADQLTASSSGRERAVTTLRTRLGADAFARAWEAGRALPLDEVVADALNSVAPADSQASPVDSRSTRLTRREREVAALIARGSTNRQIAETLFISERTVDAHVEHILAKLGLGSRTQVAVWVVEQSDSTAGST